MSGEVVNLHGNPLLAAALGYASIGWHLLPAWWITDEGKCACGAEGCKSPGKHPIGKLAPWGQNSATSDPARIKAWWQQYPRANIAVYLEPSRLCAIDIDPRNGGFETQEAIEAEHGPLQSDVIQFSGGGGLHVVYQRPADTGPLPGKLGSGIDVKANGYLMVEPSNHLSGKLYGWEASSDPREGPIPSPMPDWLRDLARAPAPVTSGGAAVDRPVPITGEQQREVESALAALPSDDRDTWLRVGMALHSTGIAQWAWDTWAEWSKTSSKYDPVDQLRVWRSFRGRGLDGITVRSIFDLAQKAGWVNLPAPVPVALVRLPERVEEAAPDDLLAPGGILQAAAAWVGATSRKAQPLFDLQAAIAFACTVLGRRYVSSQRNWPSLYLLNIGKSGSGKEHAKWAVERMLEVCGLNHLIGPASYTSSAGVLSSLHDQPSHLTVIDEFGKALENAAVRQNARDRAMLSALMEVWGRADGVLRPQGYSTVGLSERDAKAFRERSVRNPALTLLAMTTPETFFDAIGSAAARDGFLNRFLIVESDVGRQAGRHVADEPVPQAVIEWARRVRSVTEGALANPDSNASLAPEPRLVPLDDEASAMFSAFEADCLRLMDEHDQHGLAEMFGRCNEMAMRLALVAAVGHESAAVKRPHAAWAISYVRHHAVRTVARLRTCVANSEFGRFRLEVLDLIRKAGGRGMTERDLSRASARFREVPQRQQVEMLTSLQFTGDIQRVEIPSMSNRGRKRVAWVAADEAEESITS
ncbi:MAG: bifunctional DNA primase/polymerase [Xanthomonadales bacterium]|nr:bifunctional DNA primase/polymerase [Xanthomonadales bacterium]